MKVEMGGAPNREDAPVLLYREHQGPSGRGEWQGWLRRARLTSQRRLGWALGDGLKHQDQKAGQTARTAPEAQFRLWGLEGSWDDRGRIPGWATQVPAQIH